MKKHYLAINGDEVGGALGQHILNDDAESLTELSHKIDTAIKQICQTAEEQGGRVISCSGDEALLEVNEEFLDHLYDAIEHFKEGTGFSCTIGLGGSMSEASKALIYGKLKDKGHVTQYHPELEEELKQMNGSSEGEQDDSESQPQDSEGNGQSDELSGEQGELGEQENLEEEQPNSSESEEAGDISGNGQDPRSMVSMGDNSGVEGEEESEEMPIEEDQLEQEQGDDNESEIPNDESEDEYVDAEHDEAAEDSEAGEMPSEEMSDEEMPYEEEGEEVINNDQEPAPEQAEGEGEELSEDSYNEELPLEDDEQAPPMEEGSEQGEDLEGEFDSNSDSEEMPIEEDQDFDESSGEEIPGEELSEDSEMSEEQPSEDEELLSEESINGEDQEQPAMEGEDQMPQEEGEESQIPQDGEEEPGAAQESMEEIDDKGILSQMMDAAQDSGSDKKALKQKVLGVLQRFKENKDMIEQSKETNPQHYQSIMEMLSSMIEMARHLVDSKEGQEEQPAEDMNPDQGTQPAPEQEQEQENMMAASPKM